MQNKKSLSFGKTAIILILAVVVIGTLALAYLQVFPFGTGDANTTPAYANNPTLQDTRGSADVGTGEEADTDVDVGAVIENPTNNADIADNGTTTGSETSTTPQTTQDTEGSVNADTGEETDVQITTDNPTNNATIADNSTESAESTPATQTAPQNTGNSTDAGTSEEANAGIVTDTPTNNEDTSDTGIVEDNPTNNPMDNMSDNNSAETAASSSQTQAEAYFLVFQYLFEADTALNYGIYYIALDLSDVLLDSLYDFIRLVEDFCAEFGFTLLLADFYELTERGYIRVYPTPFFEKGILFSFSDVTLTDDILITNAQKWRSGRGAIFATFTVENRNNLWELLPLESMSVSREAPPAPQDTEGNATQPNLDETLGVGSVVGMPTGEEDRVFECEDELMESLLGRPGLQIRDADGNLMDISDLEAWFRGLR